MADISAKAAVNALTGLNADVKPRASLTDSAADVTNSQFLDAMMARVSAPSRDDNDFKHAAKNVNASDADAVRDSGRDNSLAARVKNLKHKAATHSKDRADANETVVNVKIKDKIKTRINEIAAQNDTPITDDKSLKALKKVAEFLVKADETGKIDLPPELVQKLQAFLAKGDDLKALDVANFMRDFSESFKSLMIAMNQAPAAEPAKWPPELVAQLKELNLQGLAQADKDVTIYAAIRLLKSLVNATEKAANGALNEKIKNTLLPQDRAEILVNATPKAAKIISDLVADAAPVSDAENAVVAPTGETKPLTASVKSAPDMVLGDAAKLELKDKPVLTQTAPSAPVLNAALRMELSSAVAIPGEGKQGTAISSVTTGITNINLLEGLNNVGGNNATRFSAALNAATQNANNQPSEATQQVLVQFQQRGNKAGSLTVQLTPAELGRVDIRLTTQRDGSVHTVIAADKPETLALLQKDSALLEKSLQQAGLNANAGNMSFNLREQRQSQNFENGRKRFNRSEIDEISTKEVALNVTETGIFSNNRVNYHA